MVYSWFCNDDGDIDESGIREGAGMDFMGKVVRNMVFLAPLAAEAVDAFIAGASAAIGIYRSGE